MDKSRPHAHLPLLHNLLGRMAGFRIRLIVSLG